MNRRNCWLTLAAGAILALSPTLVTAQSFYVGVGLGPTVVLDDVSGGRSVYRQLYGVLGFESARSIGVRLEGAESFGFAWLGVDLTYTFAGGSLRPYAVAGGGVRIDLSDADPLATVGMGLRLNLRRALALFAECRVQRVLGASVGATEPKLFLPLTVGVAVGSR